MRVLHAQNQTSAEIAEATGRRKSSITRLPIGRQIATCAPDAAGAPDAARLPPVHQIATCAPDCHVSARLPLLRHVATGAPDCHLGARLPFAGGPRGTPRGPGEPGGLPGRTRRTRSSSPPESLESLGARRAQRTRRTRRTRPGGPRGNVAWAYNVYTTLQYNVSRATRIAQTTFRAYFKTRAKNSYRPNWANVAL